MGRSPEDVMLRYDFKIAGKRAGSWSREEVSSFNELSIITIDVITVPIYHVCYFSLKIIKDQNLLRYVAEFGPRWATIGEAIGRTGPQCSLRYRQSLDPRLKWRLWTSDEVLVSM